MVGNPVQYRLMSGNRFFEFSGTWVFLLLQVILQSIKYKKHQIKTLYGTEFFCFR